MLEVNPNLTFFVENVDFSDMTDDFDWVCNQLGVDPMLIDGSRTRRNRLYWTNLDLPENMQECIPKSDPDDCMDEGRVLEKHGADEYVKTICSSWTGYGIWSSP
jgi:hypothetical protein